jgi:hypothetical protein
MTLTQKQTAQIKKATAAGKILLRAQYARQNKPSPSAARPASSKGMQSSGARRAPQARAQLSTRFAFDGFDRRHMPLDEPTAPYNTTNFISVMEFGSSSTMDQVVVICPRLLLVQQSSLGPLTDIIAVRYDAAEFIASDMPGLARLRSPIINTPPLASDITHSSVRARLHNMSTSVECLGTSDGMFPPGSVYMGSVPSIEGGAFSDAAQHGNSVKTAWVDDSIQVGYLRSYTAAGLVGKGVSLDSAVSENISYRSWRDMAVPADTQQLSALSFSTAMEPILVYVPRCGGAATVVNYRITIGQQWCTRHPNDVMLRATQKHHPATPPDVWRQAAEAAQVMGGRVMSQIGDAAVHEIGSRLTSMMRGNRALPAPPLIVD